MHLRDRMVETFLFSRVSPNVNRNSRFAQIPERTNESHSATLGAVPKLVDGKRYLDFILRPRRVHLVLFLKISREYFKHYDATYTREVHARSWRNFSRARLYESRERRAFVSRALKRARRAIPPEMCERRYLVAVAINAEEWR